MPLINYYVIPEQSDETVITTREHCLVDSLLAIELSQRELKDTWFFLSYTKGIHHVESWDGDKKPFFVRFGDDYEGVLPFRNANEAEEWLRFYDRKYKEWEVSQEP